MALVRKIIFDIVTASSAGVRRMSNRVPGAMHIESYGPLPAIRQAPGTKFNAGRKISSMDPWRTLAHSRWCRCGIMVAAMTSF